MDLKSGSKVLVCPLNWGLGHATRCIPLVKSLLCMDMQVLIAADGDALEVLKLEFPDLPYICFPGITIKYPSTYSGMVWQMFTQVPHILFSIYKENRELQRIIKKHAIDVVLSDNRYGLFSSHAFTVFITHQLAIQVPIGWGWTSPLLRAIVRLFVRQYDRLWIVDNAPPNSIAGKLTDIKSFEKINYAYIGLLSRFSPLNFCPDSYHSDILVVLSGPEPQRTIFEAILKKELLLFPEQKRIIIQGLPRLNDKQISQEHGITIVPYLQSDELLLYIAGAKAVICRSGYSSVMDLIVLQKQAILVATPGQTEQEYLAAYLKSEKWFFTMPQDVFCLKTALDNYGDYLPPVNK